jgi:hypothetical protein
MFLEGICGTYILFHIGQNIGPNFIYAKKVLSICYVNLSIYSIIYTKEIYGCLRELPCWSTSSKLILAVRSKIYGWDFI